MTGRALAVVLCGREGQGKVKYWHACVCGALEQTMTERQMAVRVRSGLVAMIVSLEICECQ